MSILISVNQDFIEQSNNDAEIVAASSFLRGDPISVIIGSRRLRGPGFWAPCGKSANSLACGEADRRRRCENTRRRGRKKRRNPRNPVW